METLGEFREIWERILINECQNLIQNQIYRISLAIIMQLFFKQILENAKESSPKMSAYGHEMSLRLSYLYRYTFHGIFMKCSS